MERAVTVARTNLADGENNVNRFRLPQFGIAAFSLTIGTKASKTHVQEGARDVAGGTDDFHFCPEKESIKLKYTLDNKLGLIDELKLEIYTRFGKDPIWALDLAKLGLAWLADGKHEVAWDGRLIGDKKEIKGTVEGDTMTHDLGKSDPVPNTKFPDGYVTLEHSPYKIKLTAVSATSKTPVVVWTYLQILIKKIVIELGPDEIIPGTGDRLAMDKAVRAQIDKDGGVPAKDAAQPRKVMLKANLYKMASSDMSDNTAFTTLQTLWSDGPNIPLVAKIRLADSSDNEVKLETDKGAIALGQARFLWEWEDPAEAGTNAGKAKAFIDAALDFYKDGTDTTRAAKDHTYPKGDNCHLDRGGKRGPDATAVFPAHAGYKPDKKLKAATFPFKVEQCPEKRKWAAFSFPWATGKLAGQTGVIFQPTRMAGDNYKLKVYLAWDHDKDGKYALDIIDEPLKAAPAIMAETGVFQNWRQIHLARYVRKQNTIPDFLSGNLASIQADYAKAFIDVVGDIDAENKYLFSDHKLKNRSAAKYNKIVEAATVADGYWLVKDHYVYAKDTDHATDEWQFKIRPYKDFVKNLHKGVHGNAAKDDETDYVTEKTPGSGVAPSIDDLVVKLGAATFADPSGLPSGTAAEQKRKALLTRWYATRTTLRTEDIHTETKYIAKFDDFLPAGTVLDGCQFISGGKKAAAPEGVTIVQFNWQHSEQKLGQAAGKSIGAYTTGQAVDVADHDLNRCAFLFYVATTDGTFQHEVGHHLCLPHSRHHTNSSINPGGPYDPFHDDDDDGCIMSYSNPRVAFCGFCQLRMRGWDATKLDKDDAKNKKP